MNNDFELWWETNGVARLRVLVANKSAHDAAKQIAREAWNEIVAQYIDPAMLPELSEKENAEIDAALSEPASPESLEALKIAGGFNIEISKVTELPTAPVPDGSAGTAAVRCGTCQNCGLENVAGPESEPVECSGCKYVGELGNIFSRPAV